MSDSSGDAARRTIRDFGDQWTRFDNTSGYLASQENLADQLDPFLKPGDLENLRIADVGAGLGRVSLQLVRAGASQVVAIEPSDAFIGLLRNVAGHEDRVRCVRAEAHDLPREGFDLLVCLGVLHHIPDPGPALRAFLEAVRPGGRVLIWVYGREGNGPYLAVAQALRFITRRLPPLVLTALTWILYPFLRAYIAVASVLPLPLSEYCRRVLSRLTPAHIRLTIFDQLNPTWARYYRRHEIDRAVAEAGFEDVQTAAKHGYSWLVSARRPRKPREAGA